jgi:hypothetical protein
MEKGVKTLFALAIISLVLVGVVSFASAGWFSDFIGKITGNVASTTPCTDQACDNSPLANGIVDSGKSCTGNFATWYQNDSYKNMVFNSDHWGFVNGEWIYDYGTDWYWVAGNCSMGTVQRIIYINKTTGWAWGNISCTQTGLNICPTAGQSFDAVSVSVTPSTISVGDNVQFTLTIRNNQNAAANDVTVSIIDQSGWGGQASVSFAALETKEVNISLTAAATHVTHNPHSFSIRVNNQVLGGIPASSAALMQFSVYTTTSGCSGSVCAINEGETITVMGRTITISYLASGVVMLSINGTETTRLGVDGVYQSGDFSLTVTGINVQNYAGGVKRVTFNYNTVTVPSNDCVNQACDENMDGVVDAGKHCSGNFTTWYSLPIDFVNPTSQVYAGGEWYVQSTAEGQSNWYWAFGNCSLGKYPRWVYLNKTGERTWMWGGDFTCAQNGSDYCGITCEQNASMVDCDNNGLVDSGKTCTGTFNSYVYNTLDLSGVNDSLGSYSYVNGEWWYNAGSDWYYAYGNCSLGIYPRWIYVDVNAETQDWLYEAAINCSQTGAPYTCTGTGETPIGTPDCTTLGRCTYGAACVQNGFRVDDSALGGRVYCNVVSNSFAAQRAENATCQQGYECISNFCAEGKCTNLLTEIRASRTVLGQLLCWVQKIFTPSMSC